MRALKNVKDKLAAIIRCGFLPILVDDTIDPFFLTMLCQEVSIPVIECSLRRKDSMKILPKLKQNFPQLIVLAGSTIDNDRIVSLLKRRRNFPSLNELYHLNIDGIVSLLHFQKKTYTKYQEKWIFIPGAEVVSQAFQQLSWGAHLIKFVNTEGFEALKRIEALQGPTHQILPIMVTGGMTPEKISPYIKSGVLVIAAGFDVMLAERYHEMQKHPNKKWIIERLLEYVNTVQQARGKVKQAHWTQIKNSDTLLKETGKFFLINE